MSLFGMLNWHYLWFCEGKGLSRETYAKMVTALMVAGAEQAMDAIAEDDAKPERTASRKKSERPAVARRAG